MSVHFRVSFLRERVSRLALEWPSQRPNICTSPRESFELIDPSTSFYSPFLSSPLTSLPLLPFPILPEPACALSVVALLLSLPPLSPILPPSLALLAILVSIYPIYRRR